MSEGISDILLANFREFVTTQMGLYFPEERNHELERGVVSSAQQFGFSDTNSFFQWLISSPLTQKQIETLASHLTVGETYFFREKNQFAVLEEQILPALIHSSRKTDRRFRCWSAGCCTGEEPYSLAILLQRLIPDWEDWNIPILATDINPSFLKKAVKGRYGKWSFRNVPEWIHDRFFEKTNETGFEILPSIKKMVNFSYLNLAKDIFPSLPNNTNAMDIIFCRNVLMYFSPDTARKVIQAFYLSLVEGGWLIVSSCELAPVLFPQFQAIHFPGAILYKKPSGQPNSIEIFSRKPDQTTMASIFPSWIGSDESMEERETIPLPVDSHIPPVGDVELTNLSSFRGDKFNQSSEQDREEEIKAKQISSPEIDRVASARLLARTCANQGKLQEAQIWCEKAIAADRTDAGLHYLRAMILQEQNHLQESIASLQRVLYLDPRFVLGYFALGNLARRQGKIPKADKYFANVLSLLQDYQPDDLLPESDGITAGRLLEIVRYTLQMERAE